jgi:hypothetical protein
VLGSETPVTASFPREKEEILRLAGECGLNAQTQIASLETASRNSYLLSRGSVAMADPAPARLASARTVAHAKALRSISQFISSEVRSEEHLREITVAHSDPGGGRTVTRERERVETLLVRSQALISQAYVLSSGHDPAAGEYVVVLAIPLRRDEAP